MIAGNSRLGWPPVLLTHSPTWPIALSASPPHRIILRSVSHNHLTAWMLDTTPVEWVPADRGAAFLPDMGRMHAIAFGRKNRLFAGSDIDGGRARPSSTTRSLICATPSTQVPDQPHRRAPGRRRQPSKGRLTPAIVRPPPQWCLHLAFGTSTPHDPVTRVGTRRARATEALRAADRAASWPCWRGTTGMKLMLRQDGQKRSSANVARGFVSLRGGPLLRRV
jgi:hypothetical protein